MFLRPLPLVAVLVAVACAPAGDGPDAGSQEELPDAGTDAGEGGDTCGNGVWDDGEACERVGGRSLPDGGVEPGPVQGCSETCAITGTCAEPIDLNAVGTVRTEDGLTWIEVQGLVGRSLRNDVDDTSAQAGSCGGSGPELVFRYRPSKPALLYAGIATQWTHRLYARTNCGDATSERGVLTYGCVPSSADGLFSERSPIAIVPVPEADTDVFLFVDTEGSALESEFTLQVTEAPYVASGASCVEFVECAPGSRCAGTQQAASCLANEPPVVTSLRAVKGNATTPDALVWHVEANDPDGDWLVQGQSPVATIELLDAGGRALKVFDVNRDRVLETIAVVGLPANLRGQPDIAWTGSAQWPAAATPLAPTHLRFTVWDSGLLKASRTAPLETFSNAGRNQPCDPTGLANRCVVGTICGANDTCQDVVTLRAAACSQAPLRESTDPILVSTTGPSLWEPPTSCGGANAQGTPEAVIRVQVNERSRVTVSTGRSATTFDTVVMLLTDCGIDGTGAPFLLGCSDDQPGQTPVGSSLLVVDNVPEGEYAVVIDSKRSAAGQAGGTAEVVITVEPQP